MPSPIGHAIAGLTVHVLTAKDGDEVRSPERAAVIVGAALAADLDLLLRFVDGRNHHQAESHSFGFAILAAVVVAAAARVLVRPRPLALGLAAGAAWCSHLALDYLNRDTHPPIGVMALWPLSRGHFKFPWPLFLDIGRTLEWATVRNNTVAVAWEVLLLAPLLLAAWRLRRGARG